VFGESPLNDVPREKLLYIGEVTGCGIVLDGTAEPEPRVLFVHHNLGGELRDERIGSFDNLLAITRSDARKPDA
jgi:hypothetical protein